MLTDALLNDLAHMLQTHSAMGRLAHTEVLAILTLMQERGWTITKPMPAVQAGKAS
ncbi:hypothetical protein [Bradyrhizobium erythrophlei]|uniref:Uncharacterized protein n=1 Tax=Bradyrhizobium erythrophlei TaxID=1437360 RepID=A0A1H4NGW0_9BRAD|nr:hypothetical protein [Bradyrhizobium erythrophlei]SEB94523.1 hypothetical protein SAMN05444164_0628 [Bradyrhizobium erythrophlei]